jgi:hypothetical protein
VEKTALIREALKALIEGRAPADWLLRRHNAGIEEYSTAPGAAELILADTSIWIDHFCSGNKELQKHLNLGHIVIHPFIVAELALGSLPTCGKRSGNASVLVREISHSVRPPKVLAFTLIWLKETRANWKRPPGR